MMYVAWINLALLLSLHSASGLSKLLDKGEGQPYLPGESNHDWIPQTDRNSSSQHPENIQDRQHEGNIWQENTGGILNIDMFTNRLARLLVKCYTRLHGNRNDGDEDKGDVHHIERRDAQAEAEGESEGEAESEGKK